MSLGLKRLIFFLTVLFLIHLLCTVCKGLSYLFASGHPSHFPLNIIIYAVQGELYSCFSRFGPWVSVHVASLLPGTDCLSYTVCCLYPCPESGIFPRFLLVGAMLRCQHLDAGHSASSGLLLQLPLA